MQLRLAHLKHAGKAWRLPDYDPRSLATGIVHLGLGNFPRAHLAAYTDVVLGRDTSWGICGVSLKSRGVTGALAGQDHLYTLLVRGAGDVAPRVIASVHSSLSGADGIAPVLGRIAAPATRIVSLTVTEKGYCHDPASGALDLTHADIVHDLAYPATPMSTPGVLLRGLQSRMVHGVPLTVMCCDNLPHNGATVAGIVRQLAAQIDPALARWIEGHVSFPSTMVDRIVPATTDADRADVRALGFDDMVPVATEPFSQWVIEDRFAAGRPAWETAGAQFVADVAPFELMKLRLLNGAHSAMAYLGYLAGHEYIHQVSADALFARFLDRLWEELATTLPPAFVATPGVDIGAYKRDLMARFRNSALAHRTWQIAMDGSQKLPQRLLGAARERISHGDGIDAIALAVAGWMRYVTGRDEKGDAIDVRDPLAAEFSRIAHAAGSDTDALCAGLMSLQAVFSTDLARDARFTGPVRIHLRRLIAVGVRATLA